jgi:hypothetical protein
MFCFVGWLRIRVRQGRETEEAGKWILIHGATSSWLSTALHVCKSYVEDVLPEVESDFSDALKHAVGQGLLDANPTVSYRVLLLSEVVETALYAGEEFAREIHQPNASIADVLDCEDRYNIAFSATIQQVASWKSYAITGSCCEGHSLHPVDE